MAIEQDRKRLASVELTGELVSQADAIGELKAVQWGDGVYGQFGGVAIEGKIIRP